MEQDISYWQNLIGISFLLIFLVWDVVWNITKRYGRDINWCPRNALFLSGLTLQFLGYIDSQIVDVLGSDEKKEVGELLKQQLVIDSHRLTLCVFLAYVVPEMPLDESRECFSNVAALVISVLFHMAMEFYAIETVANTSAGHLSIISSSTTLSVGAICLVIYLALAISSADLLREATNHSIDDIQSKIAAGNAGASDRWEKFRRGIRQLWLISHAWQKRYALFSPGLNPGAGGILTICVAVIVAKGVRQSSDLLDLLGLGLGLTFWLHCAFILIGWMVILRRWFVVICKDLGVPPTSTFHKLFEMAPHYFFTLNKVNARKFLKGQCRECLITVYMKMLQVAIWIMFLAIMLPLFLLALACSILLLFNYICWLLPRTILLLFKCANVSDSNIERHPDREVLRCIVPDEQEQALWGAVSGTFDQVKKRMNTSYTSTRDCNELCLLIQKSSVAGNRSVGENKAAIRGNWKKAAVSTIAVMGDLRMKYAWVADHKVKQLIRAYQEVQDMLEFADYQNLEARPMNVLIRMRKAIDNLFNDYTILEIERSLEIKMQTPQPSPLSVEDVLKKLREEKGTLEGMVAWSPIPYDIILTHLNSEDSRKKLVDMVTICLKDIIVCCASSLPNVIVKCGKRWTEDLQDENMRKLCQIAAKVSAIMEMLKPSESQRTANTNTTANANTNTEATVIDIEQESHVQPLLHRTPSMRQRPIN